MEDDTKPSSPGSDLLSEFSKAFFFLLSHPLYFSYFVFFSPYLLKLMSFLSPLFVTTALLVLAFLGTVSPTPSLVGDREVDELGVYKIVFDVQEDCVEVLEEVVKETCSEEVVDKCLIVHGTGNFDRPLSPESLKWCLEDEKDGRGNVPSNEVDAKVNSRAFDQSAPAKIKQLAAGVESLKWCLEDEQDERENVSRAFDQSSPAKIKPLNGGVESLKWCLEDEKIERENVPSKSVDAKTEPRASELSSMVKIKPLTTGLERLKWRLEAEKNDRESAPFKSMNAKVEPRASTISLKWCLEDEKTEPENPHSKTAVNVKVNPRAFEQSSPTKIKQLTPGVGSLKWCLEDEKTEPENAPPKTVDAKVKPRVKESEKVVVQTQKEDLFTINGSNAATSPEKEDHAFFASPEWESDPKSSTKPSPMYGSNLSARREKEWRRTLACKLFEERHSGEGSEGMDMLWETHESESNKKKTGKGKKGKKDRGYDDEEEFDDETNGQLCCLQALKFSAGKVNLGMGRPNLVKFSKALKGMGWLHSVARHAKKRYN